MPRFPLGLAAIVALAGCVAPAPSPGPAEVGGDGRPDLTTAAFDATGPWSRPLAAGTFEPLPVEVVDVPSFDGTRINVGIYRPAVPEGVRVPVIVDAGPYYADGDDPVNVPAHRLGGFLIENFVPHGYAVAQVSVRGTGDSGGCLDFMGPNEQRDLDAVVTWLGEADWSSGRVALIGRSYDGSTPFEAATFGNPHLATIVPISGIPNVRGLYFRNGSAEVRAPILGAMYWSYGLDDAEGGVRPNAEAACAEPALHVAFGAQGTATGGGTLAGDVPYWRDRDFRARIIERYTGSVFLVHGLQDWNVDPSVAVPFLA